MPSSSAKCGVPTGDAHWVSAEAQLIERGSSGEQGQGEELSLADVGTWPDASPLWAAQAQEMLVMRQG